MDVTPMTDVILDVKDEIREREEDTGDIKENRRNKLKELFSADVVDRMAEYWTRIQENDYAEQEIDFLLFEVVQYHTVIDQKLVDHRVRDILFSCFGCAVTGESGNGKVAPEKDKSVKDTIDQEVNANEESPRLDIKIDVPYVEQKRMSEQARALVLQFTLELVSFVTDVAFLFLLYDFDRNLFVASLVILVMAMLARLAASLSVRHRVRLKWLYVLGLLVALVETNSGLRLIKLSLDRSNESGIPLYWYGGKQSRVEKKDEVSVLAETSRRLAWNEVLYICCVTLLEDIPQLIIQSIFISQSNEVLSLLSQVTIGSTVLHILFQWIEAFISLRAIFFELPKIADGREMSYDQYGNLTTKFDTPFDKAISCLRNLCRIKQMTVSESIQKDIRYFGHQIRSLNLVEVRHFIDKYVFDEIAENCCNLRAFQAQGKQFTDDAFYKVARVSPNLVYVKASESAVTGNSVRYLKDHKRISYCIFAGTVVDDASVRLLLKSVRPHFLPLGYTNISNAAVEQLAKNMSSKMENIQFQSTRIDDYGLCLLADHPAPRALKKLFLGNTRVGDQGVSTVCRVFTKLGILTLERTNVTDKGLLAVSNCRNLVSLILSKTNVGDKGVMPLAEKTTKLRTVDLNGTQVSASSFAKLLLHCPDLNLLNLAKAGNLHQGSLDLLGPDFKHSLRTLDLSSTPFSATHLHRILQICPQLIHLFLNEYKHLTKLTVDKIASLSHLKSFVCCDASFSNTWAKALANGAVATCLTELDIDGNTIDGQGLRCIADSKLNLEALRIGSAAVSHSDVVQLSKKSRNLKRLGLCDVAAVNDDTVMALSSICKDLTELKLSRTGITQKSIRAISRGWEGLSTLSLNGNALQGAMVELTCSNIFDLDLGRTGVCGKDIRALCKQLKKVVCLQLEHCPIEDEDLVLIGNTWMLTRLTVAGCSKLTSQGFMSFCKNSPTILTLYFGLTGVCDEGASAMLEVCPALRAVSTVGSRVSAAKIAEIEKYKIIVNQSLYLSENRVRNACLCTRRYLLG